MEVTPGDAVPTLDAAVVATAWVAGSRPAQTDSTPIGRGQEQQQQQ